MKTYTTYTIPFITKYSPHKTIYWTLYDDRSGGFFCTADEVAPLANLLTDEECKHVWEYLGLHDLLLKGEWQTIPENRKDYIKALGKPVETNIKIPKIVW